MESVSPGPIPSHARQKDWHHAAGGPASFESRSLALMFLHQKVAAHSKVRQQLPGSQISVAAPPRLVPSLLWTAKELSDPFWYSSITPPMVLCTKEPGLYRITCHSYHVWTPKRCNIMGMHIYQAFHSQATDQHSLWVSQDFNTEYDNGDQRLNQ